MKKNLKKESKLLGNLKQIEIINQKNIIINETKEELKLFNFNFLINWEENKSLKS